MAAEEDVAIESLRGQTLLTGNSATGIAQVIELCRGHGFEARLAPPARGATMQPPACPAPSREELRIMLAPDMGVVVA